MERFAEAYETEYGYRWKIYRYDETGNREIVLMRSEQTFGTRHEAEDDASDYADDHGWIVKFS